MCVSAREVKQSCCYVYAGIAYITQKKKKVIFFLNTNLNMNTSSGGEGRGDPLLFSSIKETLTFNAPAF